MWLNSLCTFETIIEIETYAAPGTGSWGEATWWSFKKKSKHLAVWKQNNPRMPLKKEAGGDCSVSGGSLLSEYLVEGFELFGCRCPTGDETADGVVVVVVGETSKCDMLLKPLNVVVGNDYELLVCGRVQVQLIPFASEHLLNLHCHFHSVAADVEIEVVGEEGFKLRSVKPSFRNHRPVLLLYAEEIAVGIVVGEHHGFATQGSTFRSAYVEGIAMVSKEG